MQNEKLRNLGLGPVTMNWFLLCDLCGLSERSERARECRFSLRAERLKERQEQKNILSQSSRRHGGRRFGG